MREPERCAYCGNIITGSRNKRIKLHFCSRTCSGMYHKLHPANTRPGSGPETQWTPVQIVITAAIPVYPELQPQVGRRYNAERYAGRLNAISYIVEIGGKRICAIRYTADFSYKFGGKLVVEDVKSGPTRTKEYLRNKKFMRSKYGIDIQEV